MPVPSLSPAALPRPFDPGAAGRLRERFAEHDAAFAASPEGAALLGTLGGHSTYLADLALREPATLLRIAERGPDEALALALAPLTRADPGAGRDAVDNSVTWSLACRHLAVRLVDLIRPLFPERRLYRRSRAGGRKSRGQGTSLHATRCAPCNMLHASFPTFSVTD